MAAAASALTQPASFPLSHRKEKRKKGESKGNKARKKESKEKWPRHGLRKRRKT